MDHPFDHATAAVGAQVSEVVAGDLARVQQLLSNLLANACAHGSLTQPVEVEGALEGDTLVLRVRNGGRPIPSDQLSRLFEPYYRPPASREGGGLGLGLHICAQITAAHGGHISVTSDEVDGTTFMVRLPAT